MSCSTVSPRNSSLWLWPLQQAIVVQQALPNALTVCSTHMSGCFTSPRTHTGTIQPSRTKVATCNHSLWFIFTVGTSKFATGLQKSGEVPCIAPHTSRNKPFTCQTFKVHAYTPTPILLTQPTCTHHYRHQPNTLAHCWSYTHHSNLIQQLPW